MHFFLTSHRNYCLHIEHVYDCKFFFKNEVGILSIFITVSNIFTNDDFIGAVYKFCVYLPYTFNIFKYFQYNCNFNFGSPLLLLVTAFGLVMKIPIHLLQPSNYYFNTKTFFASTTMIIQKKKTVYLCN